MNKFVTYKKDGIDCFSRTPFGAENEKEAITMLHKGNVREQTAKAFKDMVGEREFSMIGDNQLGYYLLEISDMQIYSQISHIEFHSNSEKFGNIKY